MLRFKSLGSGSSGNATVVEAHSGTGVTRVLIDCGFSLRHLEARLAGAGLTPDHLDAVFVTHEHGDHVGCVEALSRRYGTAVWMSRGTYIAIGSPEIPQGVNLAQDMVTIEIGELQLCPFTVPHDAREPLQLSCSDGAVRLGVVTDLGHASAHVVQSLSGCDALILESNHDPDLLQASRYPPFLKKRVAGRLGHLSNPDSAELAKALHHAGLKHLVAAHLSERNNRPELVRASLAQAINGQVSDILVADACSGTPWLEV